MHDLEITQGELDQLYGTHVSEGCFMLQDEWELLVRKAYHELIHRARTVQYNQIPITYAQLGGKIGLTVISDWFHLKIAWVLYACATLAYRRGFPLITALVVNSDTGQPGGGFWSLDGIPQELYRPSSREVDTKPFGIQGARD